jgi:glycine dehydrogenase subunit 2
MSALEKTIIANDNMNELDEIIGTSRALKYEEKLIFEQSTAGSCGVDFNDDDFKSFVNKTGQNERKNIGLPEVTEPTVVRHFVRLSTQNYSIDSGIFPLGSCTMKHNPRLNEKTARFDGFANLHPLQPESQSQGALALMFELQNWLKEVSGLDAVALSPAAGAHGELAGIMAIHAAHVAKGNPRKTIIVPDSAHGTNPATAATCGYEIITVPTEKNGRVNVESIKAVLNDNVAGIMLTNPNTAGLYESDAHKIAEAIHSIGAYFYCDGANFNAIVGKVKPAYFGVDVMHFNLHKTFSTPHGGGGPGSGPIAVCKELAPYIPVPYVVKEGGGYKLITKDKSSFGRLRGFNGQFGMFVRALTYMLSHGGDGLQRVAEDAVLNANYIRSSLKDYYNIPFDGYCKHEFLMNDKLQKENGVTTMDIAKTLIEYGIHPMTVYFPLIVQAAMLVEPTETENKQSLDRLIAVFKKIAEDAKNPSKADAMHQNPISSPRRRLDEVKAAKELKLVY